MGGIRKGVPICLCSISRGVLPFRRFSVGAVRNAESARTKVAVVGSGPSGLYASISLLRRLPWVSVDVIEAAPVPFGLVRYGVAPDHQEVKNCIHQFEKMFETNSDRVSLLCNVRVGSSKNEVSLGELRRRYSSVLLAYGASRPKRLQIPGANCKNVLAGSDLVSWYSGRPSSFPPLLDHERAVIIGNGNVALDCARVLALGKRLANTDVPDDALALLKESKIREILIIGRRGPADVSFTIKELREQFRVEGWHAGVVMEKNDEEALRQNIPTMERPRKRLLQVLLDNLGEPKGEQKCTFLFRHSPSEIEADENGRVKALILNGPGESKKKLETGLVVASLGYEPVLLEELPTNKKGQLAMRDEYRVDIPGEGAAVYASGWCVRGARGVIADSQGAASKVAAVIAEDLKEGQHDAGVQGFLKERGIAATGWNEWKELDERERKEGEKRGKIREKIIAFPS